MNIQNKMTLLASACLVSVVALIAGLSVEQSRRDANAIAASSTQMLQEAARDNLQAEGTAQALRIQQGLNRTYEFAQALARQLLYLKTRQGEGVTAARQLRLEFTQIITTGQARVAPHSTHFLPAHVKAPSRACWNPIWTIPVASRGW